MKKIFSILIMTAMIISMVTITSFAATGVTMSVDKTSANKDDTIIVTFTLNDTNGVRSLGIGAKFDSDFVLGYDSKSVEEYEVASWVGSTYLDEYDSLGKTSKWGDPVYGADTTVYSGYTYANAQYAKATAVTKTNENVKVLQVLLKVNTSDKKQAVITMPNAYWGDASNNKVTFAQQELKINLNGYTEGGSGSTGVVIDGEDFTNATDGMTSSDVKNTTVTVGDSVYNMGENGKVYTFFKKTVDPLTAGSYGVKATIGGKEYKFPGKANVPANGSWVIKFIAPNGTFQDGTAFNVTSSEAYFN